jgi:hypothetical protein
MKLFIDKKCVAAALAVAAVATLGASSVLAQNITVGERIGNAYPNHYDPITHKQVTGWTVEEATPQKAHTQSSHGLRPNQ